MTLLIDIGNARIKWCELSGASMRASDFAEHSGSLRPVFESLSAASPARAERVIVSNVAGPGVAEELRDFIHARYSIEPRFVVPAKEAYGIRCAYSEPERLGVDRWVAMVAARDKLSHQGSATPFCVIDAGTAVTFDAVDEAGQHLGGLIMPGPRLVAELLDAGTSDIGQTTAGGSLRQGLEVLGKDTSAAVGNASWLGLGAALDRATDIVTDKLGTAPSVYLTGGDAPILRDWLLTEVLYERDLVLEGLAVMDKQ